MKATKSNKMHVGKSSKMVQLRRSIKDWNREDRPREKLMDQGRRALTDVELMAILIGSGTKTESAVELCRQIMAAFDNDLHSLARAHYRKLCNFKGMGPAKAVRLIAAMELGRRRTTRKAVSLPLLDDSYKVYQYVRKIFQDLEHEEAWVLYLNSSNRLVRKEMIGKGGSDFTPVDIRAILQIAMESKSPFMILTHNHPSGTMSPSQADIHLTDRLQNAALICDVEILDHVIYTDNGYVSFRDDGYMAD